jgi:two-component system cell cycle sensor histidine kinase/response regulator CckA
MSLRRGPKLRPLLDEPEAALALLDRHGAILAANNAYRDLAGFAPRPLLTEPGARELAGAIATGQPLTCDAILQRDDGPCPIRLHLVATGLRSPRAVLRLLDQRPLHATLARQAHAQRLQEVGQLAAGIAHDFNNLLTAIMGGADVLAGSVPPAHLAELAQIRASATRGAGLVRQLLAFSAQQTLQPRGLALNDRVRDAAAMLTRLLGGGIALRLVLDEPGRWVCMDAGQLDQILVNLAVNARNAMPDGGTITITTGRRLLLQAVTEHGQTLPPGRYVTLDVADTGCGMAPDIVHRIFDPFFTTRREAGGTGLGLSTVHGIVAQSHGYLAVRSAPGQGSCFTITLPRHQQDFRAAVAAEPVADAPPAGALLLLVEDEAPIRRLAARALTRAGWQVVEAASAEEAMELELPGLALVVSDVMMPGMDGPALVRALRGRNEGLRAILMSGYAGSAQRTALAEGRVEFLPKPFAMAELVSLAGAPCP